MVTTDDPPTSGRRVAWAEVVVWLLPVAAVLLAPMDVNDLAYQIQAGHLMRQTGAVLRMDVFTFTMQGYPWVDQQWGGQLVFGALFPLLGWRGLVVVRAALTSLAVGMTYRRTLRTGISPPNAAIMTLLPVFAAFALPGGFFLRPQLLTFPLFVAGAQLIQDRHEHPRRSLLLVPLSICWANLHGSFILVPVLVAVATAVDLVRSPRSVPRDVVLLVSTLLAGLATPWGVDAYRYIVGLASNDIVRLVAEWQPLIHHPVALAIFSLVTVATVAVAFKVGPRAEDVEGLMVLALLTALSITSGRFVVWWALYVPPVVAALVRRLPEPAPPTRILETAGIALVLVTLVGGGRVATAPVDRLLNDVPLGITNELTRLKPARIFNLWWGSWFELSLPESKPFIDARLELFSDDVWRDYGRITTADPSWDEILVSWEVDAVVIPRGWDQPLFDALDASDGWVLLYEDEDGFVFVPNRGDATQVTP